MSTVDDFLIRAENVPWFTHVGDPLPRFGAMELVQVTSWKKALARTGSVKMADCWMEGQNILTCELGWNHKLEYRKWNDHVYDARDAMEETVFAKSDRALDVAVNGVLGEEDREFLKRRVRFSIIAAYMECVYAHLVEPRLYALIFKIYEAGHFPCGWNEVWPNGKLWVY